MAYRPTSTKADPATQSNYLQIPTSHVHLDWTIDWEKRLISGSVTHTLAAAEDGVKEVVFDTSYLEIRKVRVGNDDVEFKLDARHPVMGSALRIPLRAQVKKGQEVIVTVEYSTTDECTALGWLDKEQTPSKRYPFLYSQCQAIHARSLAPLQDTPSVKLTYSAKAHSPLPILFSALRLSPLPTSPTTTSATPQIHEYRQPVPIPSYLIAIAGGDLAYRKLGDRSGVWADPERVEAARWEFEDCEKFIQTAESFTTPYEWGTYDVLVLPESFPYGGMENSNLTFVTPTLLAGDRSLVDVVAHEISHSWFGNLIGCADWGSFWLNEGWTTYLERLILLSLHGPKARGLEYIIGYKSLTQALQQYVSTPRFQALEISYEYGEDPDDAFSTVPYDKGSNFLLYLERLVGGLEVWRPYVVEYVKRFRGKSIRTEDWRGHLLEFWEGRDKEVARKLRDEVDWEAWLHGTGTELPVKMEYDTSLADAAYALAKRWDEARKVDPGTLEKTHGGFGADDIAAFDTNQKLCFFETLESYEPLPSHLIHLLNKVYSLEGSRNTEIGLRWYLVALKGAEYTKEAAAWVTDKGRMKFCRPTFKAIYKVDPELAKKTFKEHERFYHPIARNMIAKDLKLV